MQVYVHEYHGPCKWTEEKVFTQVCVRMHSCRSETLDHVFFNFVRKYFGKIESGLKGIQGNSFLLRLLDIFCYLFPIDYESNLNVNK